MRATPVFDCALCVTDIMTGLAFTDEVDWKFSGCPGCHVYKGVFDISIWRNGPKRPLRTLWDPLSQHSGNTMSPTAPLTFSERVGLILLAETSAVSASAILGLLSYIAVCSVRHPLPKA